MEAKDFVDALESRGLEFFTGIPDSHMEQFCSYLVSRFGTSGRHIMPANEGSCAGIAAGYHLATGKVPVVYMQNSGLGNFMNPFVSMLSDRLFGMPCLLMVGWKGEPGKPEQPQHVFQGQITEGTLKLLSIPYFVLRRGMGEAGLSALLDSIAPVLSEGGSAALLVTEGSLTAKAARPGNDTANRLMSREQAMEKLVTSSPEDAFVATTGKTSRELFEIRQRLSLPHRRDFLVIGSMGHASSVALGIALNKPGLRVWCLDRDGSVLMHMGSLAAIGASHPRNLIHVILDNGTFDSVGGQPTMSSTIDFPKVAEACGYPARYKAGSPEALDEAIAAAKRAEGPALLEISISDGSRADLGWPQVPPKDAKEAFMGFMAEEGPLK